MKENAVATKRKYCCSIDGILLLSLLLVGGFHEYISCLLSVVISIILLLRLRIHKKLVVRKDLLTSAVVAICLCYGVSCIWAVDKGMAVIGFLKFLPLLLYLIYLQQQDRLPDTLKALPWFGIATVLVSAICVQFPVGKKLFSVAERLAGFFQYPNTYAIFVLVCELLVLKKENKRPWDYVALLGLIAGFLYTGSRTAFVVAVLSNIGMLLILCKKRARIILLAGMAGAVVLAGLFLLDKDSVLYRYLTISLTESTFVGRLLYWADALPLLIKYPFGMGYMGYYYVQQSIQTGVYSVVYIHNDFLQMLLDIGWIPFGLFAATLVKYFRKREVSSADKLIVCAICVHSFFDFNLQYISIFFLLLLFLSAGSTEKKTEWKASVPLKVGFIAVITVCLYMGAALMLSHFGLRELSDKMYPYNTQNKLDILEQTGDLTEANALADEILAQNKSFYAPYGIKARYSYSQGDFASLIMYMRQSLQRNPFLQSEYEQYCKMLITGIDLYTKAGDTQSAKLCRQELLSTAEKFSENAQRLSALGKMIDDQPVLTLSADIQEYIRKIGA